MAVTVAQSTRREEQVALREQLDEGMGQRLVAEREAAEHGRARRCPCMDAQVALDQVGRRDGVVVQDQDERRTTRFEGPVAGRGRPAVRLSDQLDRNDLAWVEGTPDWVPLRSIEGVVSVPGKRENVSERKVLIAFLLAWFIGPLGIHRLYQGKWATGILYLVTGGLLGIGVIYDFWTLNDQLSEANAQCS